MINMGTDSPMAVQASGAAVARSGREADSTAAHTANVTGGKDELLRIVVPVTLPSLKLGRHAETENPLLVGNGVGAGPNSITN